MKFDHYDDIVQITPLWTGERFPDGRPKVPDKVLERIRRITLEEAWGYLWNQGYKLQFQSDFRMSNPAKNLVGRAVTTIYVPKRPDLDTAILDYGHKEEGRKGFFNQWVLDTLVEDDVVVVDLFDKIYEGTYVGGNLSTAISTRTKNGGAVIWGGVRDLEQIVKIQNINVFYRGCDPTGIGNVTMTGFNCPCRVGNAICLPGDVVLGTISGVIFIPPHLAENVAFGAEKSHIRDVFGFQRLGEKIYTTAQIDTAWTVEMWEDFIDWHKKDERAGEYQHLDFASDLDKAKEDRKKKEEGGSQVRLS